MGYNPKQVADMLIEGHLAAVAWAETASRIGDVLALRPEDIDEMFAERETT